MEVLNNIEFLESLDKNYKINNDYVEISKKICKLDIQKVYFEEQEIEVTIKIIQDILFDIDSKYLVLFNKMLKEKNENNPIIYIYNSNSDINESVTIKNQIHFYKENNISDVYILLHEFTHYILNSKNIMLYKNKEILPILMEFIISNKLGDNTYIIDRLNDIITNSKSLLIKNEIINNNYNLDKKIKEYNINNEELSIIEEDILCSKDLDYFEELSYIKGFIYAYYYNDINNYKRLINNFKLDNIDINKVFNKIKKDFTKQKRR